MDKNEIYIQNLKIEEIPWHRITTTYGRATEFPKYLKIISDMEDLAEVKNALSEIRSNVEHQNTLWHVTPFSTIFLMRILKEAISKMDKNEVANYIVEYLLKLFIVIAECYEYAEEMGHADELALFSDMLKEEYLWSEEYDEDEDISRYEEGIPDDLFYSFYYYSYQTLLHYKTIFCELDNTNYEKEVKVLYLFCLV